MEDKQMEDNPAADVSIEDFFGPVIVTYTRAQALADEALVDATSMAREAGFEWPLALTQAAWQDCVAWTEQDNRLQVYQDESGRLWDVLFMAHWAIKSTAGASSQLCYALLRVPRDGCAQEAIEVTLKLMLGAGDAGEPVITIMLPNED